MTPHSSFVAGRIGQELDLPHALAQVVEHRAGPFEQGAECRFDPLDQEEGREPDEAGPIGKPAPAIWHALALQITTNRPHQLSWAVFPIHPLHRMALQIATDGDPDCRKEESFADLGK